MVFNELWAKHEHLEKRVTELENCKKGYIKEIERLRGSAIPLQSQEPPVQEFAIGTEEDFLALSTHQSGWLQVQSDGELRPTNAATSVCPSPRLELSQRSVGHLPPPDEWQDRLRSVHQEYFERVETEASLQEDRPSTSIILANIATVAARARAQAEEV